MVRYAEWRSEGHIRWSRERWAQFLYLPIGITLAVASIWNPTWPIFLAIAWGPLFALYETAARLEKRRSLKPLRDLPATLDQFAVAMELSRGGHRYGSDQGLVSVIGGWLHFEGTECAFALPSRSSWTAGTELKATFEGPAGRHSVKFTPLERKREFRTCFLEWLAHGEPPIENVALPPVVPESRHLVGAESSLFGAVATFIGIVYLSFQGPGLFWCGVVPLSCVGIAYLYRLLSQFDEHRRLLADRPPRRALP